MRTSACGALRAVSTNLYPGACRFVAGRRLPYPRQTFHTSPNRRREDGPGNPAWNPAAEQPTEVASLQDAQSEAEGLLYSPEGAPEYPRPKDKSNYGSAARRAGRNIKKVKELPPVHIPPWFLARNIVLCGELTLAHRRGDLTEAARKSKLTPTPPDGLLPTTVKGLSKDKGEHSEGPEDTSHKDALSHGTKTKAAPHQFDGTNLWEIVCAVAAGLQVSPWQRAEITTSLKPHLVLLCPKDGTSSLLDLFGLTLATENGTDFLRLSPQDIAEIGGDYLDEPSEFKANTLSSLGYDAPLVIATRRHQTTDDDAEEEDFDDSDEDGTDDSQNRPRPVQQGSGPRFGAIHVSSFTGSIQDVFKSLVPAAASPQDRPFIMKPSQQPKDITPELKLALLVETILNAPEIKRVTEQSVNDQRASLDKTDATGDATTDSNESKPEPGNARSDAGVGRGSEGLIVLIEDYPQINTTVSGGKFLDKLHEVVDMRRREGQKILIIGTASSKDLMPSFTRSGVNEVQNEPREGPTRTIILPIKEISPDHTFAQEHKRKMKETNLRHIRDMLRRSAPDPAQVVRVVMDWDMDVDSKAGFLSGLDESIWSIDRVSRIATTALGLLEDSEEMTTKDIERALELIESSDTAKVDWMIKEKEQRKKQSTLYDLASGEDLKERMRKLRKTCNEHERKLLNGVVNPEDIRTTFADVQAPPATIDALKTLTSLSLVRPDAFTYGVLATDRIPGLLLYGPPGTGKTLLAKAVAKESGATVLEVSGSDVYDMYVGEGEKNVKAIFSLAKKLTPCIVFIDEADAILGARSGGGNRTSHRELINQFLREWDGMTEMSAFIMVATNRPFDLDEASLRRLPRRLLVDLPVEKDREAILKIHLKDEILDPEVSLSQLASQTPFYSGSDLKNLSVAAALACVREEFDTAASHKESADGEKYQYPEKRTLHPRHFTKAMEEISASISEDMGSLSAIRKFDEKYGDRRGRRKKGGYGFKTVADNEKAGSDSARVRNQT